MFFVCRLLFIISSVFLFVSGCSDHSHEQEMKTSLLREDANRTNTEIDKPTPLSLEILSFDNKPELLSNHNNRSELDLPVPKAQSFEELKHGVYKEFFPDGKIKEEVMYFKGVQQGPKAIWFSNGQVAKMGEMKDDRWHGKYKEWYQDGTLKLDGQYNEGKQDGKWSFFDKDGEGLPSLQFKDGIEMTRKLPSLLRN
jgi:hypothetical protein